MTGQIQPYRPVTPADRVDAIDTLVDAVQPLFNDVYDRAADYPGFIQSDEQRSPIFAAARSVARLNCRLWAASDKGEYSIAVNARNSELCGPYLDDIGENPDGADTRLPFSGGQCEGVTYQVTWNRFTPPGPASPQSVQRNGPLGFSRQLGPDEGNVDCGPGVSFARVTLTSPQGDVNLGSGCGVTVSDIVVTRLDGLPDSCGNPSPETRPPATVTPVTPIPPSVEIDLPGVGPVDVTVNVDVTGNPEICIPVLGVCGKVEVNPDGGGDGGSGGGGGAPPLDPEIGEPITNPPGGGGGGPDNDFGEPPEGRIWVGAYVELLGDLTGFGVIPRDLLGQAALSTVVGNASLNVQGDNGLTLRSTYTQIRSEWSEHIVPVLGLQVSGIRVKVNPELGYRVYPVSVKDPLAEST